MPKFVDIPDIKTKNDELSAVYLSIAAELEAIMLYRGIAERTKNPNTRKVMLEVANEEVKHLGEFGALLEKIEPKADEKLAEEGEGEAGKIMEGK